MSSMSRIYLDYAASTPLDPAAASAMARVPLSGNPSSIHEEGRVLRAIVEAARRDVATLAGCGVDELFFTSGASEGNAIAIISAVAAAAASLDGRRPRIVSSAIEHASVNAAIDFAEKTFDAEVLFVEPGRDGVISAADMAAQIDDRTALVCLMHANNVIGTLQPVADVGRLVADERARRASDAMPIFFLCDATQSMSLMDVRPAASNADFLTFSGHKMYGPKGVGALYARRGIRLRSPLRGGDQESGWRGGTENVPAIAGFAEAAKRVSRTRAEDAAHCVQLDAALREEIRRQLPQARIIGAEEKLPSISYIAVPGVGGDELTIALDIAGIAVSYGSSCDSGKRRSYGVVARLLGGRDRVSGVRVSFGRDTKTSDLIAFIETLRVALARRSAARVTGSAAVAEIA